MISKDRRKTKCGIAYATRLGGIRGKSPTFIIKNMKTAQFTNFTDEEFEGAWDGKVKRFKPGQSVYMPDYLAQHYAKHLVNRELLRRGADGSLVYKDGEKFVSPKQPEQVPQFMELFNKAYTPDGEDIVGEQGDDVDTLIDVSNKNKMSEEYTGPSSEPQTVLPPDFDESGDESSFEGAPVESE